MGMTYKEAARGWTSGALMEEAQAGLWDVSPTWVTF